jgi:DNA-binding NarL/FixJ family response regulator
MNANLKILLVDDHQMFLDGLDLVLTQQNIDVVTAENTPEALSIIDGNGYFDLIFVDLQMPGLDGYALIRALRERQVFSPVIVISASEGADEISRALELGALGYLPKSTHADQIGEAIRQVLAGNVFVAPELSFDIEADKKSINKNRRPIHEKVSARQLDILRLTAEGYSNKEIALAVNVAEVTVKYHLNAVFKTLQVSNRTACVKRARELGII